MTETIKGNDVKLHAIEFDRAKTALISLHQDGKTVGELWLSDDGKLRFEGDVEESARLFFDHVIGMAMKNVDQPFKLADDG